jgi:hypothetical protein
MTVAWEITGEYVESCNCEVLCPCLLSRAQARPTEGHCDVVLAVHVTRGQYDGIDLSRLNAALVIYTPDVMARGGWTVAPYVDAGGGHEQRAALEGIISGLAGGPLARFDALIATRLPARVAPITVIVDGRRRVVTIHDVAEVTIEGIVGADGQEVWLDNVGHFASRRLSAARGERSRFEDRGFAFDNSGRNGHYAPIRWSNA